MFISIGVLKYFASKNEYRHYACRDNENDRNSGHIMTMLLFMMMIMLFTVATVYRLWDDYVVVDNDDDIDDDDDWCGRASEYSFQNWW